MTDTRSDVMLMTAVRRGDARALTPLFERHSGRLFGFLRGLVASPSAAEDLVQETFLRILRHRQTYRPGSAFLPWLLGIARNTAWTHLKKQSRMPAEELPELVAGSSVDRLQHERERANRLTTALQLLPEKDREILLLSYFDGLRHQEIADLVDSTEGAVKVRAHRAKKKLRRHLADLEDPS